MRLGEQDGVRKLTVSLLLPPLVFRAFTLPKCRTIIGLGVSVELAPPPAPASDGAILVKFVSARRLLTSIAVGEVGPVEKELVVVGTLLNIAGSRGE